MNDFSYFADVILPEASYLERDESILDKSAQNSNLYYEKQSYRAYKQHKKWFRIS